MLGLLLRNGNLHLIDLNDIAHAEFFPALKASFPVELDLAGLDFHLRLPARYGHARKFE